VLSATSKGLNIFVSPLVVTKLTYLDIPMLIGHLNFIVIPSLVLLSFLALVPSPGVPRNNLLSLFPAQNLSTLLSGFHQVALRLGLNGLRLQELKEYSDSCSVSNYLGPVFGSKCLVMQTTGDYLGLRPLEETSEKMFQVATRTFNPLYCFPYLYTYWSHFSD
jgi:hypothetical protein